MSSNLLPGQRLKQFVSNWHRLSPSRTVMNLVRKGYKMSFDKKPKLSKPLPKFETRLPEQQMNIVRKEVATFLEKKAIRVVPHEEANTDLGFYSKIFCVPKPGKDKWRMIIDMRRLNKCIKKKKFRMQGIKDVTSALKPHMYGAVIDISDAYYHVPIRKGARKYTRFIVDGIVYEFLGLPMGLCCSPRIFTCVSKFASNYLRKQGVIIIIYIDDLLILGNSYKECKKHVAKVLNMLRRLGFIINESKCVLEPLKKFTYLGCVWDTEAWTVGLKEQRVHNIRSLALQLIQSHHVKVRDVAKFLGRTQSVAGIVPLARLRSRSVLYEFSQMAKTPADYNKYYEMSQQAREQLSLWTELDLDCCSPISFLNREVVSVDTDASDTGYGWLWQHNLFSEKFQAECLGLHINTKELWALLQFIRKEKHQLKDTLLSWRCDNNSALAAIKK